MVTPKSKWPSPVDAYAILRAYIAGEDAATIESAKAELTLTSDGMRAVVDAVARINKRTRLFGEAIVDRGLVDISDHQILCLSSLAENVIGKVKTAPRTAIKTWIRDASSAEHALPHADAVAVVRAYVVGSEAVRVAVLRAKDRDELTKSERRELLKLLDEQDQRSCVVFRDVGNVAFDAYSSAQVKLLRALALAFEVKDNKG